MIWVDIRANSTFFLRHLQKDAIKLEMVIFICYLNFMCVIGLGCEKCCYFEPPQGCLSNNQLPKWELMEFGLSVINVSENILIRCYLAYKSDMLAHKCLVSCLMLACIRLNWLGRRKISTYLALIADNPALMPALMPFDSPAGLIFGHCARLIIRSPYCRGIAHYAPGWSPGSRRDLLRTPDPAYECERPLIWLDRWIKQLVLPVISANHFLTQSSGPPLGWWKNWRFVNNELWKIDIGWRFLLAFLFLVGFWLMRPNYRITPKLSVELDETFLLDENFELVKIEVHY